MECTAHASEISAGRWIVFAAGLLVATASASASGVSPRSRVQFDVTPLAVCEDVTTDDFRRSTPREKLVRTELDISTMFEGSQFGFEEFLFQISSPGQRLLVVDHSPRTTLSSEYAGTITVESKDESTKSAGVTVNAVLDHFVNVAGSGDIGVKNNLGVRYELLSPKEPVTASGTVHHGTGVYFKLRPTPQTTVEGARRFSLTFRVPDDWCGDYLRVHCQASTTKRGLVRQLDEAVLAGTRDFFVALYLAGDTEAKKLAEQMIRSERVLRQALFEYRQELEARSKFASWEFTSWEFTAPWSSVAKSPAPVERIERVLFQDATVDDDLKAKLPSRVGDALTDYLRAREMLQRGDYASPSASRTKSPTSVVP